MSLRSAIDNYVYLLVHARLPKNVTLHGNEAIAKLVDRVYEREMAHSTNNDVADFFSSSCLQWKKEASRPRMKHCSNQRTEQ